MRDALLAVLFTGVCWWFGTGIILWLDRLPARSFRWSLLGWSGLLLLSFWGVYTSMHSVSVGSAWRPRGWASSSSSTLVLPWAGTSHQTQCPLPGRLTPMPWRGLLPGLVSVSCSRAGWSAKVGSGGVRLSVRLRSVPCATGMLAMALPASRKVSR